MVDKTQHRQLQIEQREQHYKPGLVSSAPGTVSSFCSDNNTRRATSKRHEHNVGHQ